MSPTSLDSETPQITLSPGQLYFGSGRKLIHTLLGSCVAITLWHPRYHIGGMCHYLLAHRKSSLKNERQVHGYYGSDALEFFCTQALNAKVHPSEFEVKVFGGGQMFKDIYPKKSGAFNVAQTNREQGIAMLEQRGFKIKSVDVGGFDYRKIYLELWSGSVWVQYGKTNDSIDQKVG